MDFLNLLCTILRLSGHSIAVPCWAGRGAGPTDFGATAPDTKLHRAVGFSEPARGNPSAPFRLSRKNYQLGRISGIGRLRRGYAGRFACASEQAEMPHF